MFKIIRHKAPFILLGLTLALTVCSYFGFYATWFRYLPDLVGYSIFTNLFMISVYMNNKYCDATKLCVLGLIALNMFNLISHEFDFYREIYDLYLIAAIIIVIGSHLIKNKK
tara:strand:+ start:2516 stop:2851 length:336 start_codon:yes stop_codon:yes gene_type:complete